MRKKKQAKIGFVLPYSIWEGLKNQPPQIIRDAIDCCVEYDKHWLETDAYPCGEKAAKNYAEAAMVVFSFAKPLIDANNRRYYERLYKKKESVKADADKTPEELLDDSIPI